TRYQNMPQPRAMAAMRELFAERRDGSRFPVEVGLTPLEFPEGTRILATIMDVSIQKDIQKSLVDALLEKTSLLNEVHHRVKNNLQVVSSLLNLQSRGVPEDVRKHFDESQGRVKAMALIHQQLYEQKSYEQIEAVSYLKNLCDLMRRSYTGAASHISIDIHSDNGQVYLMMDQALPFGLLVNELVTNAIKHAFIGRESGTIEISLIQDEEMTEVMVRDDGIGLPENVELSTTRSLGFQLIPGLAEQLEAELTLIRSEGTRFEFRFATQAGRK
ncbi:sensor histidine kinase, partial [Thalassolituus sp.]|uniref:sensor histidine kinase n=1 Tax=Thalassolituus sp. TaxID=2030822 RepID=UPI003515492A